MLNDHIGGIRKAGLAVANAELSARTKTEDRAVLEAVNCSEMECFSVGGGKDVTQKVKVEDTEVDESEAVTVMLEFPSSASEGVPKKVRVLESKESHPGREDVEYTNDPLAGLGPNVSLQKVQEKGWSMRAMRGSWFSSGFITAKRDEQTVITDERTNKRGTSIGLNNGGQDSVPQDESASELTRNVT
jgi:hypothetical protein